jgi:hypothetical protein
MYEHYDVITVAAAAAAQPKHGDVVLVVAPQIRGTFFFFLRSSVKQIRGTKK